MLNTDVLPWHWPEGWPKEIRRIKQIYFHRFMVSCEPEIRELSKLYSERFNRLMREKREALELARIRDSGFSDEEVRNYWKKLGLLRRSIADAWADNRPQEAGRLLDLLEVLRDGELTPIARVGLTYCVSIPESHPELVALRKSLVEEFKADLLAAIDSVITERALSDEC